MYIWMYIYTPRDGGEMALCTRKIVDEVLICVSAFNAVVIVVLSFYFLLN